MRRAGVEPVRSLIRGGTDGARLTEKGLPTPNLFTGGQKLPLAARVGERAGHGRGGRDGGGAVRVWGESQSGDAEPGARLKPAPELSGSAARL